MSLRNKLKEWLPLRTILGFLVGLALALLITPGTASGQPGSCGWISGMPGCSIYCDWYYLSCGGDECQEEFCDDPPLYWHRITFCVAAGYRCVPFYSGCSSGPC